MDETRALDALAGVLNELSEHPYDISLHARHIHLAQSLEVQVQAAWEMFTQFLAAGEDVWLDLIKAKEASVDLGTAEGVEEILALYSRAEADYLCASAISPLLRSASTYPTYYSHSHPPETLAVHHRPPCILLWRGCQAVRAGRIVLDSLDTSRHC